MPNKPRNNTRPKQRPLGFRQRCLILLLVFLVVGLGSLALRLYYLQIHNHEEYRAEVEGQQILDRVIHPERGQILDANGKVLAKSTIVWDIVADPSQFAADPPEKGDETPAEERLEAKIRQASDQLAELLELDRDEVYAKLSDREKRYVVLKKKVDKPVADQVTQLADELNLMIKTQETTKREYPYGAFAASVLGFCNSEGEGFYGLERYYDQELAGVPGRIITLRNGRGEQMSDDDPELYEVRNGSTLTLTLDATIQGITEHYLEDCIKSRNVQDRGLAIVMDVNTGAILSMAVKPDFDPNQPYVIYDEGYAAQIEAVEDEDERAALKAELRETQWKNKAITDLYYPGSVFKIITAASALDSAAATRETQFACEAGFNVLGQPFRCAEGGIHHTQDMTLALRNSCNRYFVQLGQQMGPATFFDYFNAFGFTEATGVDLPNEQQHIAYYDEEGLRPVELATVSFGQGNKITPLQMITAASAAVNGGYLVQPHIVQSITDAQGNLLQQTETVVKRQVISQDVSAQVVDMMRSVVDNGKPGAPGRNAYVAGYDIAGKSGTSEKLDVPLLEDGSLEVVSSFLAVLPADDPQIAVLVVLDDPRYGRNFGSELAAPVVGNIISEVAPYLGLATDPAQEITGDVRVPNLVGRGKNSNWDMAQVELNRQGLDHRVLGEGPQVIWQYPYSGQMVPPGTTVYLYTDSQENIPVAVPDVTGQLGGQAAQTLKAVGLNVEIRGPANGTVLSQDEEPGSTVPMGEIILVNTADETVPE